MAPADSASRKCRKSVSRVKSSTSPCRRMTAPDKSVAVIRLQGEVDDFTRDTLFRHFREAESAGAITISSQASAIRAPIVLDQTGNLAPLPAAERAKMQSPILRDFEDSARRSGYNPLLVDAMVKVETTVYLVADAQDHERIIDEAEYKKLTANGEWKDATGVTNPIDGPDTLLTVGPDLAHRLGLSKSIARNAQELAVGRGLNIVADLRPGVGDHLVEALNSHGGRFVLLVVFMLSLYICLHAPGHGAAEAVAVVSLGLLAGVPMLTGYAQWWELGLIFVGLGLCAFELLVFPGHGLSLGVGLVMVLFGLLMTFVTKDAGPGWFPTSHQAWHQMRTGLAIMVGAAAVSIIFAAMLRPFLPKLPIFRRFILTQTNDGRIQAAGTPLHAGEDVWPFVGTVGVALTDLRPGGLVQFPFANDMRSAPVVSVNGFVNEGAKVVVQ